jgi:hypothetical protein
VWINSLKRLNAKPKKTHTEIDLPANEHENVVSKRWENWLLSSDLTVASKAVRIYSMWNYSHVMYSLIPMAVD